MRCVEIHRRFGDGVIVGRLVAQGEKLGVWVWGGKSWLRGLGMAMRRGCRERGQEGPVREYPKGDLLCGGFGGGLLGLLRFESDFLNGVWDGVW